MFLFLGFLLGFKTATAAFDSDFYHNRYGLPGIDSKLVDDRGDGYENLYGVRNFREVLNGVLYRGGGNNLYNRNHKDRRSNRNPLPQEGVRNLCEEGFRHSIYLYPTNASKITPNNACASVRGANRMVYEQLGFQSHSRTILERIHAAILDPEQGPIYVHCWNGWHASGYVGALALKQFCDATGDEAVDYWVRNTDGNSKGYQGHRDSIRGFVPYADLKINRSQQTRICPSRF